MNRSLQSLIAAWERKRGTSLLIYHSAEQPANKGLTAVDVPAFYKCLRENPGSKRIDLLLTVDGGFLNAARRIAELLHAHTDYLTIFVPREARSAGTFLCLAAHSLVVSPIAELSPIDPLISPQRESGENLPKGVSSEDIRAFLQMSEKWFQLRDRRSRANTLSLLTQHFFPTSLSSFYRAEKGVIRYGAQMLKKMLPRSSQARREQLVTNLVRDYPEHSHTLTYENLREAGLPVKAATENQVLDLEELSNALSKQLTEIRSASALDARALLVFKASSAYFIRKLEPAPRFSKNPEELAKGNIPTISMGTWEFNLSPTE